MGKLTEENSDKLQALVESGALDRPKKPAMTNTTDIPTELEKILLEIGDWFYWEEPDEDLFINTFAPKVQKLITEARMNEVGKINMGDVRYPEKRLDELRATLKKGTSDE